MSSFILHFLVFSLSKYAVSALSLQTTLTPLHQSDGATMTVNPDSVTISPNEWKVEFHDQSGYDLHLQLSDHWGFDSLSLSNITLTLNGINYNQLEGDLLFIFSISNTYFGLVIRNEISSQLYKTYPEPSTSTLRSLSKNVYDSIISPSSPDRYHRICESTNWFNTVPLYMNPTNLSSEWPLILTITNDPRQQMVHFSQRTNSNPNSNSNSISDDILYTASFLSSFPPRRGLSVYMMTDGSTESFGLYSIEIELQCTECSGDYIPSSSTSIQSTTSTPSVQSVPLTPLTPITPSTSTQSTSSMDSEGIAENVDNIDTINDVDTVDGVATNSEGIVTYSFSKSRNHGEDARMASIIMGVIGGILCLCVGLLMHFCFLSQRGDPSYDFEHRSPRSRSSSKRSSNHRKYSGMRSVRREHDYIPKGQPVDLGIVNRHKMKVLSDDDYDDDDDDAVNASNPNSNSNTNTNSNPISNFNINNSNDIVNAPSSTQTNNASRVKIIRKSKYSLNNNVKKGRNLRVSTASTSNSITTFGSMYSMNLNNTNPQKLRKHLDLNRLHRPSPVPPVAVPPHLEYPDSAPSELSSITEDDEHEKDPMASVSNNGDSKVGRDLVEEGERMTNEAMKQLFSGRALPLVRKYRFGIDSHRRNRSAVQPLPSTGKVKVDSIHKSHGSNHRNQRNRGQSVDRMTSNVSTTTSLMVRGRTESQNAIDFRGHHSYHGPVGSHGHGHGHRGHHGNDRNGKGHHHRGLHSHGHLSHHHHHNHSINGGPKSQNSNSLLQREQQRHGIRSSVMGTMNTMNTVVLHENVSSINSVDYHKLRKFLDDIDDHDGNHSSRKHHDNSDARSHEHRSIHCTESTSSDEQILEKSERKPFRMDV